MVELFIDNKRVVLPANLSIKLTDENPILTESGKYSFDIELPLRGCAQNLKVFGPLDRFDVSKGVRAWSARLLADNHVILSGIATATSYSRDSIKIQLVGGNSEYNFLSKFEELYIDELYIDLSADIDCLFRDVAKANTLTESERQRRLFGAYGDTNFVYLPVLNSNDGEVYNNIAWHVLGLNSYAIFLPHASYAKTASNKLNGSIGSVTPTKISHQPYFCYLLRKIFGALGYKIVVNDIENSPMRNCYVVTSHGGTHLGSNSEQETETHHYGRTSYRRRTTGIKVGYLPHWTLQEFIQQVSRFFGVSFYFNDRKGELSIRFKTSPAGLREIHINEIVDEYSAACDGDEYSGEQAANLHFDCPDPDPYQQISDEILEAVRTLPVSSLPSPLNSSVIYDLSGKQYIYYQDDERSGSIRVNRLRDLILSDNTDAETVSLGIVPVRMVCGQLLQEGLVAVKEGDPSQGYYPSDGGSSRDQFLVDVPMPQVNEESEVNGGADVYQLIEGSAEIGGAVNKECIELAICDGNSFVVHSGLPAMPYPFTTSQDARSPWQADHNRGFSLELNEVSGEATLYQYAAVQRVSCNRQVEYTVRFITDQLLDPTCIFVIRGKRFYCKQLVYQITRTGISALKTGVFYEAT